MANWPKAETDRVRFEGAIVGYPESATVTGRLATVEHPVCASITPFPLVTTSPKQLKTLLQRQSSETPGAEAGSNLSRLA